MAPSHTPPSPYKLNILALPSHTALLFGLIALVVLGAAFSSLLPGSQLWPLPVVLGLTLLPLRDFLHRPDRHMADSGLAVEPNAAAAELQRTLIELAPQLTPPVQVAVSKQPVEAHAFGTFRRRYLGLGRGMAGRFANLLRGANPAYCNDARTILAHELAHFINRDVQLVWLAYGLLKMMVIVMVVNLLLSLLAVTFILEVGPEVLRVEFWSALSDYLAGALPGLPRLDLTPVFAAMQAKNPALIAQLADPARRIENWQPFLVYLASCHTPFFLSGVFLWAFYWQRLLRVREFYADARAAALMGDAEFIPRALLRGKLIAGLQPLSPKPPDPLARGPRPLLHAARRALERLRPQALAFQQQNRQAPTNQAREECLHDPLVAFGSERSIAVSVGLAVILLDGVQRGTLTALHITEPGAFVPMLAAFLAFGLWTLPRVCAGRTSRRDLWRSLVRILAWFTALKLVMYVADLLLGLVMMVSNPASWGRVLDTWVYGMVGAMGPDLPSIVGSQVSWAQVLEWHTLRPLAFFGLLMPPVLFGWLAADAALKRRALTWYGLAERVRGMFWAISGGLAALLALLALPLLNRVLFGYIYTSWSALELVGVILALLLVAAGATAFVRADRRYGRRCPRCGRQVADEFQPGNVCPAADCGQPLHEWLIAPY